MTDLKEFIADVESRHFRTPYDTGANPNAMMIWNVVRAEAGMPSLTEDDLVMKYYVGEKGMTPDKAREAHIEFKNWYDDYRKRIRP